MKTPTSYDRYYAILNTHPSVVAVNGSPEMGDEVALNKDDQPVIIDESKIAPEIARLKAEWDSQDYARKRREEYDVLNQFELIGEDSINDTTNHKDAILAIKAKYPKE